jgi:hypothetical protein
MNDLKKVSRGSQCEGTYALVSCAMPRRSAMMLALAVSAASAYEGKVSVMLINRERTGVQWTLNSALQHAGMQ